MPVFSTLGALTYTKVYLGDTYYWYIETTPGNQNTFDAFDINDNKLYIGGNIDYTGNTSAYNPNFINVIESNFSLPTDNYHAFYSSGSNRIGSISSVSYDVISDKIYITGGQNITGTTINSVTRVLNSNLTLNTTYVDEAVIVAGAADIRQPTNIITFGSNNYTIIGTSREGPSGGTESGYITNYTGNTKNWAKTLGAALGMKGKITPANNYIIAAIGSSTTDNFVVEIASNGNTILRQYRTGINNVIDCAVDSANNIYYAAGPVGASIISVVGKIDSTGNVVWQKQMSGNVQTTSALQVTTLEYANGNIFIAGQANAPGGNFSNGLPLGLMSFSANTGNLNWQRTFKNGNGIVLDTIGLKYANDELYVSGTQKNGGFMIKVPSDGLIPGNGTYSGNLTYTVSNVAISNANIAITTSNITLSNAVTTSITTSNITANTANLYTFNSTRLA